MYVYIYYCIYYIVLVLLHIYIIFVLHLKLTLTCSILGGIYIFVIFLYNIFIFIYLIYYTFYINSISFLFILFSVTRTALRPPSIILSSPLPDSLSLSILFSSSLSRLMEEGGVNPHWLPWHQTDLARWRHVVSSLLYFPGVLKRLKESEAYACVCVCVCVCERECETVCLCQRFVCVNVYERCQWCSVANASSVRVLLNQQPCKRSHVMSM